MGQESPAQPPGPASRLSTSPNGPERGTRARRSPTPSPTPARLAPRVLLTVEQPATALGIGRTTTFALIASGELPSVRAGRLRRVPLAEIHAYTTRLMAKQHHAIRP